GGGWVGGGVGGDRGEWLALERGKLGVAFAHHPAETLALERGKLGEAFAHHPAETLAFARGELGVAFAHDPAEMLAFGRAQPFGTVAAIETADRVEPIGFVPGDPAASTSLIVESVGAGPEAVALGRRAHAAGRRARAALVDPTLHTLVLQGRRA